MRHKSIVIFSVLFVICSTSFSQKSFMKFGNISKEEMEMTSCSIDTSAGAVVLGDFGTTNFDITEDEGFYTVFTRHVRIKILDKDELDQGDFVINLYESKGGDEEKVTGLKAVTYNLEKGQVEKYKLERKNIFREKASENWNEIKFSMPNVKVGSVIDVTYTITSPFYYQLQRWFFQTEIPTIRSEYHVYIPEYYNYKNWSSGYIPIKKESDITYKTYQYTQAATVGPNGRESGELISFKAKITHWSYFAENVPAFKNEPKITSPIDYLSNIDFELLSTDFPGRIIKYYSRKWEDIRKELMEDEDFGKQLNRTGHLKEQVEKINSMYSDPIDKMAAAYEFIKNKMVWTRSYRLFANEGIRKPYTEGGGTSAEINLNLVGLCHDLGLDANPVLVSTRNNGKLRVGQVILTQFNHVIASVKINDQIYLLDCTDSYCPYYILPRNTLNGKGLILTETSFSWIDLYTDVAADEMMTAELTIDEDMQFVGSIKHEKKNYAALKTRKEIKEESSQEEYLRNMEQDMNGVQLSELNIDNLDSIYKPLNLVVDAVFEDKIIEGGDMLYFNPVLVDRLEENIFKNDERQYPVDYNYPLDIKQKYTITIPDGYAVEELPKSENIHMEDNGGSYIYKISAEENKILLETEFTINGTIYPSNVYNEIKKFYELMVAKQAEQVILKQVN